MFNILPISAICRWCDICIFNVRNKDVVVVVVVVVVEGFKTDMRDLQGKKANALTV